MTLIGKKTYFGWLVQLVIQNKAHSLVRKHKLPVDPSYGFIRSPSVVNSNQEFQLVAVHRSTSGKMDTQTDLFEQDPRLQVQFEHGKPGN